VRGVNGIVARLVLVLVTGWCSSLISVDDDLKLAVVTLLRGPCQRLAIRLPQLVDTLAPALAQAPLACLVWQPLLASDLPGHEGIIPGANGCLRLFGRRSAWWRIKRQSCG